MNDTTKTTELITPERAANLLANRYEKQRNINKNSVRYYASDMLNGRWMQNGEPIIISDKGHLLDGQHRMSAIIKANIPITMDVTYGVDEIAYNTIDKGRTRSTADGLRGIPNASKVATVAKVWCAYSNTGSITQAFKSALSHVEVQNYAFEHLSNIQDCVARSKKIAYTLGTLSLMGYAAFECANARRYTQVDVERFAAELEKGNYSTEPAVQMLIRRIMRGDLGTDGGQGRATKTLQLFSYSLEKWVTHSRATKNCNFKSFDLSKFNFDPEQVS